MITTRGVTSLMGPSLCVLALGAIAVAALGQSASGQRMGLVSSAPTHSRYPAAANGPSCPLSLAEQVKSIKAFAQMMPVFRHARCINCHGGVDPFSDQHLGADQVDPKAGDEQCQDCHDELPGWRIPGDPVFFTGKDDEQLCLQMKRFSKSGADFVEHIRIDHNGVQFIAAGFKGDRALGEGLKDYGLVIERPPGTQEELTEKARRWVKAMGGEFVGSPECGCVKPRIDLKMKSEWTVSGGGTTMTPRVSATVPLKPDTSGLVFQGTAPLENGVYSIKPPPGFRCRIELKPPAGELEVTEARFDVGADQRMTISLAVAARSGVGTSTWHCPKPLGLLSFPLLSWAGMWGYLHQPDYLIGREYHFDQFEAASGLSLAGEPKLVGRKEVTRKKAWDGLTATAKTTFEFWWVGLETPAK